MPNSSSDGPHTLSIQPMPPKKDYRWLIYHTKGTPAQYLGSVYAPDEETALQYAYKELDIPENIRSRVIALRQN
jgi:hypothetical protein